MSRKTNFAHVKIMCIPEEIEYTLAVDKGGRGE